MPLEPSRNDIESEWAAFKRYVCEPYQNNPERLATTEFWFDELYARRNTDELDLSYREIKNEATGRGFNAFCLNNQIYFSHDAAVLTLPYPRDRNDVVNKSDRLIGVWLSDIGALDKGWQSTYQNGLDKLRDVKGMGPRDEKFVIVDHNEIVFGGIKKLLSSQNLLAGVANYGTTLAQMRISDAAPLASNPHRDIGFTDREKATGQVAEGPAQPEWNRFIIHTLHGAGTTFLIGEKENIAVPVLTGATSSHFAAYIDKKDEHKKYGALHQATVTVGGRAILTPKEITGAPFPEEPTNPWLFKARPVPGFHK